MPPNDDTRNNLFSRLFRAAIAPGWPRGAPAILLLVGAVIHFTPQSGVRSTLAAVVLAGCLANLARIGTHLRGGYLWLRPGKIRASEKPAVRKHLSALTIADLMLTLIGIAWSIVLIDHPEVHLLWRVLPACILSLALYVVALATVDRADELELDRGTEIVLDSDFGSWLFETGRKGTKFPPIRWLVELFDEPTPEDEPSTLVLLIALVLLLAPVTTLGIELTAAMKKQAVAAWSKLDPGGEEQDGKGEEQSAADQPTDPKPQAEPATRPRPEPEPMTIRDLSEPGTVRSFDVTIRKTLTSDPGTPVPIVGEDVPYLLVILPLMVRWRQVIEARGGTPKSSLCFTVGSKTTFCLTVIDK
jgi:hypothetical protein